MGRISVICVRTVLANSNRIAAGEGGLRASVVLRVGIIPGLTRAVWWIGSMPIDVVIVCWDVFFMEWPTLAYIKQFGILH